jgi:cytochrome b
MNKDDKAQVWDWPVRLTHWLLVLTVIGAWATQNFGGEWFQLHTWLGYTTLVLVAARLIWGFVGTRHAKFSQFVRGPGSIWRYARALVGGEPVRTPGHNPLGALMVLVLLALLLAQAITGLFANDEIAEFGPLVGLVTTGFSNELTTWHHKIFEALQVLIVLHVLAAFAYLWVKRENLLLPMLTGSKSAADVAPQERIAGSRVWLWLLIIALLAGALAFAIRAAPEPELFIF